MNPNLYDLLNLDQSASTDEIRAAWKAAIADLDPTDRRFRAFNQAAETLLDPARRSAYDAGLASMEPDEVADAAPDVVASRAGAGAGAAELEDEGQAADLTVEDDDREPRLLPLWAVGVACVLALVAVVGTIWLSLRVDERVERRERADAREQGAQQAAAVAEEAVAPVLSYDYRQLDDDVATATPYFTDDYADEYRSVIEELGPQAKSAKLVVQGEAIATGIIRSGDDLAEILVFVNQASSRDGTVNEPLKMWVTMTMVHEGDSWLIDKMKVDTAVPN